MLANSLYLQRDRVSAGVTLTAGIAAVVAAVLQVQTHIVETPPPQKTITIELTALTEPVPQRPAPPPPATPAVQQRRLPSHPDEPLKRAAAQPAQPSKADQQRPAVDAPAHTEPATAAAATPDAGESRGKQATPAESAMPPPPPPPPQPLPKGNSDHTYEASILALVEAHKVYPTGRQAMLEHPAGVVHVCATLARNGVPEDARVAGSSGSMLLDQAAKRLITGLTYPPMPEQAFGGQAHHEFCMNVEYQSPSD